MIDQPFSAVALFCQDIREEIGGTVTLVGVTPDNGAVAEIPSSIPKFCAYIRVNFPSNAPPDSLSTYLVLPDGSEVGHSDHDTEPLRRASAEALAKGNPLVGSVGRIVGINFTIPSEGLVKAMVRFNGEDRMAGFIRFSIV